MGGIAAVVHVTLPHLICLTHNHTPSHSPSLTHHTLSHSPSLIHHRLSHPPSPTATHCLTHPPSLTLTHAHTISLTLSLALPCRVQGSGFRVQGSGFRVQGSGFRVQGSGLRERLGWRPLRVSPRSFTRWGYPAPTGPPPSTLLTSL